MIMQETRRVALAFAVRPEDILTRLPAWPADKSLKVFSGDGLSRALPKDDGYFIFTGTRPDSIRVTSGMYEDFFFTPDCTSANALRVFLIPRRSAGRCVILPLGSGECAHIGFYGEKSGYPLMPESVSASLEITLNKDDYSELTGLFHVLIHGDKPTHSVYVSENLGHGRYRLSDPLPADYPLRGTRLLPLFRIVGNSGDMRIPVPAGSLGAYLLRGGSLQKICMEEQD